MYVNVKSLRALKVIYQPYGRYQWYHIISYSYRCISSMLMIELCNDEKNLCNLGLSNYQQIIKYIHAYVYINIVDNKSNLKLEDF